MISGIANSPIPDRENELILSSAMEKAIPLFMKIPVLHVDHTERPIGYVTECRVVNKYDPILSKSYEKYDPNAKIGDTYFEAVIPEDGDTEDIWGAIQKGRYNKISIYGVRTAASDECKLLPHQRVSPCITKAIRLWSFSLVGNNAINPGSYIKIAKSFNSELCEEFQEKTIELIKAGFPGISMAPDDKKVDGQETDSNDATMQTANVVMKSELDPVIQDVTAMKGEVAEIKTGIADVLSILKKSDTTEKTDEKPPEVGDYITKAALESTIDILVKAKMDVALGDIKKAYDDKIAAIESKLESFGKNIIEKGGRVVVLSEETGVQGDYNPFVSNMNALGE